MSETTAKAFHEAYERLAPSFGYTTRVESAVPWGEVPDQNRLLMIAVTDEVVGGLEAEVGRLREALREAARMTDFEEDRTLIHNHCMQAVEATAAEQVQGTTQ